MKSRRDISKREKSATVGLVVCFVAMIAIVGLITFGQYQNRIKQEQQRAEAETNEKEDELLQETNTDSIQAEIQEADVEVVPEVETAPTSTNPETLSFEANEVLMWPIDGNVILSYSMDNPVYFATLDQYKYNPALIISGEVGTEVFAAAEGKVLAVETSAQTGTTITIDIGSGFQVVYGQLKEVCVEKGDHILEGNPIGYVSEPTKYYSVEGPNLYFQLLKDGVPVNPLEYLDV